MACPLLSLCFSRSSRRYDSASAIALSKSLIGPRRVLEVLLGFPRAPQSWCDLILPPFPKDDFEALAVFLWEPPSSLTHAHLKHLGNMYAHIQNIAAGE